MSSIQCPLQYNAENLRNHVFAICKDRELTYENFYLAVRSTAIYLKVLGIQENDRVAIFSSNSIEYLIVIYALWRIKAISCLINTRLPGKVIDQQLKSIDTNILITNDSTILGSPQISAKKINLNDTIKLNPSLGDEENKFEFDLQQPVDIIFTSGSTDKPKAAMHTIGNHIFSAKGSNENIQLCPKDKWLLTLPLYHVGGLSIIFRVLLGKSTIVLPSSNESILDSILEKHVTHLSLVPTQLNRLISNPENVDKLKYLKSILVGGSAISDSLLLNAVTLELPIYTTYGSTEMSSQIATSVKLTEEEQFRKAIVLKYREVKISDENEILVKGPTLFAGYVTGQTVELPVDEQGWFQTGDLGHLADGQYLTVYGRKDNMFTSGGENIQPEEIERFLCQIKEIEQAIVVAIPNNEYGNRPIAFIRSKDAYNLNKQAFIDILTTHLPKYKIPDEFYLWPQEWEIEGLKENRQRLSQLAQYNNPDLKVID